MQNPRTDGPNLNAACARELCTLGTMEKQEE